MALVDFIPQNVVTALLIDELRKSHVFGNLVNEQNPGGLGRGESYKIPGIGDIDVGDYAGTDITIQEVTDTNVTLTVDQAKYFGFYYDKVQNAKSARNVISSFASRGSYKLGDEQDIHIAQRFSSEAGIKDISDVGTPVTPIAVTDSNVLDLVANVKEQMDDNNVPQMGRWIVVPPFMAAAIAKTNIENSANTLETARTMGWVQNYLGLNVYMSNNLDYNPVARIVFDRDFVTSNTINAKVNGVSISQVTFSTDQATTAALVVAAFEALAQVSDCIIDPADASGRTFLVYGNDSNLVTDVVVAAGADQAVATVTYEKDKTFGIHPIASINSSLVFVNTLSEIEMFDKTEKRFAELIKGLNVYGSKVKDSGAIVRCVVSKG